MPRETLEAHAPIPSRWLPTPVPGYRPTSEGTPNLPNKPRLPHIPHFRHAGRIATLGLAGAVALTAAEGFTRPHGTADDPIVRAGEIPAELMRYPWDSGNVHLDLQYTEVGQNTFEFSGAEITSEPEVVSIGEGKYVQFVLGSEYGEADDPYGHVKVELLNDVMEGGVWEKSVDAQGNTILNPEGKPILNQFGHVEPIPGEAGQPVSV